RKLFDIVWGCLTTIFACTWVSMHPNVPPPDQSWLAHLWRRLKMMLIAVLAPEVIVGFAARQWLVARSFSKGTYVRLAVILRTDIPARVEFNVSTTHGFFFCMGGFLTNIIDKSKGDVFSKGVALAQALWFVIQCLARIHQHLPVTELEVATLAFAVVNVFVWLLWWAKPLHV
ncbi:hypothetical protein B0H17DRAFT_890771, partial [Mycena rosella]